MRSRFSILGHPLHPMMVTVPVGLFTWAFVCDLIYLAAGRDQLWYDISFWTGIAAIVTAVGAALPGFGDYVTIAVKSNARVMATLHMVFNLVTVVLFLLAAVLMLDEGATEGGRLVALLALHGTGVGLLAVSGVLGGEMVYRHHLAVLPGGPATERPSEEHAPADRPRR